MLHASPVDVLSGSKDHISTALPIVCNLFRCANIMWLDKKRRSFYFMYLTDARGLSRVSLIVSFLLSVKYRTLCFFTNYDHQNCLWNTKGVFAMNKLCPHIFDNLLLS